jgi:predicted nucleic acid-binding protein
LNPISFEELFISDVVIMELYQGAKNRSDLNFIIKEIADFKVESQSKRFSIFR